jgi:hypothetical protein
MPQEPTSPDLLELTQQPVAVIAWAAGQVTQLASYIDIDAARAAAAQLGREPG